MKFTLKSGDKTLVWEDGYVDEPGLDEWIAKQELELDSHPEGFKFTPGYGIPDDSLTAYLTLSRYLGEVTGEPVEPDDEGAELLYYEATDDGDD